MTHKSGLLVLILTSSLLAVDSFAQDDDAGSIQDRLEALERLVVTLDTRLANQPTIPAGSRTALDSGVPLSSRLDRIERELSSLTMTLQRLERQVDTALRQAGQAERRAEQAERQARDAANRIR
jgi:chromosome segregation ATPase